MQATDAATDWDPALYLRFAREREQPGLDLLALLKGATHNRHDITSVVDLGCGTGALTLHLADMFPATRIVGLDSSPEMLGRARALPAGERILWHAGRIEAFAAGTETCDVIFTNAALHWVADQNSLWPALMQRLRPRGVLAAQIPRATAPWRTAIAATRTHPNWASRLAGVDEPAVIPDPAALHHLLAPFCPRPDIRETIWWHVLPSLDDVLNWLRGTTLRPVLGALDADAANAFLADLREALDPMLARTARGEILFPFPRLFVLAARE